MMGLPPSNLKYMPFFAHDSVGKFGQQSAAQLPWFRYFTHCVKYSLTRSRRPAGQKNADRFDLCIGKRDTIETISRQKGAIS